MKIMLIEDDEVLCNTLARVLKKYHRVDAFTDSKLAMEHLSSSEYDVVLTDVKMPGFTGIDVLKKTLEHSPTTHVILFTGYGTVDEAVKAIKMGAYDYILKPVNISYLILKLEQIEDMRLVCNAWRDEEDGPAFIFKSPKMQKIMDLASSVASTDSTILITGETGVGKTLLAKFIHDKSLRKGRPFLSFNCANIQESLFEGELFGYKKGAFTGATRDKKGIVELAHHGTLLIDEITEMPMNIQAKFLKFIEEKSFFKLGDEKPTSVDVRLILTTNSDIEELVREKKFREDLYYRINVFRIHIPPLRERKEDIPPLSSFFVEKFRHINPEVSGLSEEALQKLINYEFPGNVRELSNIIERAMILSRGEKWIFPGHIILPDNNKAPESLKLDDVIKSHILSVIEYTNGDKARAARILGIDRSTLYRKLKEYGILKS